MKTDVQICNIASRLIVASFFRDRYSAKVLRRNMRVLFSYPRALLLRRSPTTKVETFKIGSIEAEMLSTKPGQNKILLFLHGGGYIMGSLHGYRRFAWDVSNSCNVKVLQINYRLAPEHPYPAALEDAMQAYQYLRVKYPNSQIAVGGDSAGGGLALALTMALRDEGGVLPDQVFAISPWTNLEVEGESIGRNQKKDFWLSQAVLRHWAACYYAKADPKHPYISPVNGDFSKFPPLLIFAGDQEILQNDSDIVIELAKKAGVKAQLHIGKDMQHIWFLAFPFLTESRRASATLKEFLEPV